MNIMFFLTPKSDVTFVYDSDTMRQALEKMENHHFSCVPVINEKTGIYVGTLSEGDLLWDIKKHNSFTLRSAEDRPLMSVKRVRDYQPVDVEADIEDLLQMANAQNFVPVTDDTGAFIGIITRTSVMNYLREQLAEKERLEREKKRRDEAEREIERKFLVRRMPEDLSQYQARRIEQAYLASEPVIRVRRMDDEYFLTYKSGGALSHTEIELPLTRHAYEETAGAAGGALICKTRYLIPERDGLTIELDVFDAPHDGLVIAEVEFPDEETAAAYLPPDWFGEDVTSDRRYHNVYLSRHPGVPE